MGLFSNYRTSSLRFDIEKKHHYRSFRWLRFASISMPLKGNGNEADFLIFYLMLIFSDFAADHGLINYIETKAKGCHLKKFTCKGTLRQCLSKFIGWSYISIICWYFWPSFVNCWPSNLLSGSTLPPLTPFPVWISIKYVYTIQCVRGASDKSTPAAKSLYRSFF